jgi:excinuclease ABC subunit A
MTQNGPSDFVKVIGARQNNLRGIDVEIPRNAFVVFTGVSGSGKSSLAFGTIYAEAQRRYFDSIAPYARRLIAQLPAPKVTDIHGLPPAVALKQRRAEPTARSSVGTLTKISNSIRMLFSRAGAYPAGARRLDSDAFSPNTLEGACSVCHGIGVVHTVTESSLVPDPNLTIREKAVAAWPGAWQGKNYRDILAVLGYDVDKPWKDLPQKDRDWILFTEEKPVVTVHAEREAHRIQRPYQGTYMSAATYVRHTFSSTNSATLRKRVAKFMDAAKCTECNGKRLKPASLAVKFAGRDISELVQLPLSDLSKLLTNAVKKSTDEVAATLVADIIDRIALISEMGLDYLTLDRSTPMLSAGELQRLRLITQIRSGLFSVVYVLDEPSAGLHPADSQALVAMLHRLKEMGNSLFVVEHEMDIARQADWIVDIGPEAGDAGGSLLYSGPVPGLADCELSITRRYLFEDSSKSIRQSKVPDQWFKLKGATRHNLKNLDVDFPLGLLTVVTGVSGSGKSTLVSQVLTEAVRDKLGQARSDDAGEAEPDSPDDDDEELLAEDDDLENRSSAWLEGFDPIKRFVSVDQKPIGRTPRSNLATYTGLFDQVRKKFAATEEAKARKYNASRFSFNVAGGRCETCQGEGYISVELLFLPSVYSPCATCHGARYNEETLQIKYRDKNIADVLELTVDSASEFFGDIPVLSRALKTLRDVGLGYLHLGQPATELSGGEAQRIKLATELQRVQVGNTLYVLDEPTAGLHPADTEKLVTLLHALVDQGNTVIVVEHDLEVVASADWLIDLGPGAGAAGGCIVALGCPTDVAKSVRSTTGSYLAKRLSTFVDRS